MPKRLLDDSLLSSPSLAKCSPRAQDAWPRFILLMDDFGCSEANPRVLVGKGWPLRADVTEHDVWAWLEEYVGVGMACLWTEKERRWVYLTGWDGPHGQKKRAEYDPKAAVGTPGRHGSKRKTPTPPADLVAAVVSGARRDHDGKPPGVDREGEAETFNDFTPAREMTGNMAGSGRENGVSREFPVYAVPDPVPVLPHTRARVSLVSPFGGSDPHPATTAVLAALFKQGIDAAPPSERQAERVEAAIRAATIPVAVERLAAVLPGSSKKPLTFHVDAIRAEPRKRSSTGDLGCELTPWHARLTPDERRQAQAELNALGRLDPDLAEAPLGIAGNPESPAWAAVSDLNARWRAVAEGRA